MSDQQVAANVSSNEGNDHQQPQKGSATPPYLVDLPEDILRIIFAEFLPKPTIHIVSITCVEWDGPMEAFPSLTSSKPVPVNFDLTPADNGSFETDYDPNITLRLACKLGREIVHKSGFKPVHMVFDDGAVGILDVSADVVCFNTPYNLRRVPTTKLGDNGTKELLKAGALVTSDAWRTVLRQWIEPGAPSTFGSMAEWFKPRDEANWEAVLCNLPKVEEFYFALPEVSQHDWDTYYHKFPTAFHERDGFYVVVDERPLHDRTIDSLRQREFAVNVADVDKWRELNPHFAARMDAQMPPAQRVSLLLGLLEGPNMAKRHRQDGWKLVVRVLARRPSKSPFRVFPRDTSFNDIGNLYDRTSFRIRTPGKMSAACSEMWNGLYPGLSEADWMKMTMDRMFAHSEEQYSQDAAHEREG